MKVDEIKKIAQDMGIKPKGKRKAQLILAIQEAENNEPCFGARKDCGETACLWHEDCLKAAK